MQRHVTSVFSQYDTMDNNSANSKQLEYWLKQISNPSSLPNFGYEWTFMSNQSSYQDRNSAFNTLQKSNQQPSEEVSFGGKTAHSSIEQDKENNSFVSNKLAENKSKSYVNAMLALQKKVKTLEDENNSLRKNLSRTNDDKKKSMSESFALQEQLKNKIKYMEPKLSKMDQLIEQNKVLRVSKQQKNRKIKLLQKNYQQMKNKYQTLEQNYQKIKAQKQQDQNKVQTMKKLMNELQNNNKQLEVQNKKLNELKNQSSVRLMQNYKKSLDCVSQLQKENVKLKNQVQHYKSKISESQQKYSNQITKFQIQIQKFKQNIKMKESLIEQKKSEVKYFKQALQNKNSQVLELIKASKIQQQVNKKTLKLIEAEKQSRKQNIKQISLQTLKQAKQQIPPSKESSIIQIPQTLVPGQKMSFNGFQSESEQQCQQQFDESCIPNVPMPIETKSVGKPIKMKKTDRKKVLSSESRNNQSKSKKKQIINLSRSQKQNNMLCPKQTSKISKKKKHDKTEDENSFVMKSCEAPRTQPMNRITFQGDIENCEGSHNREGKIANSYYYIGQYPPIPHASHRNCQKQQQIQDFNCNHNISNNSQSVDAALIVQLQKQLLMLYQEQQNLLLASKDQFVTPSQRSQYFGRIHQICQLLNVKNNKICELKLKTGL